MAKTLFSPGAALDVGACLRGYGPAGRVVFSPDLGGLVTCPPDRPPMRAERQHSHPITAPPSHGVGSRKQRWPPWLSVPVPEITMPNPLYLQMRKLRTPDWARDLPRSRLSPTRSDTP